MRNFSMAQPSNYYSFDNFFDSINEDVGLGCDLDKLPISSCDINQSIDSDDDHFLDLNLPEITKNVMEGKRNNKIPKERCSKFADVVFPTFSSVEILRDKEEVSFNDQFTNSCSLHSTDELFNSFSAYNSTEPVSGGFSSNRKLPSMLEVTDQCFMTSGVEASNYHTDTYTNEIGAPNQYSISTFESESSSECNSSLTYGIESSNGLRSPLNTCLESSDQYSYSLTPTVSNQYDSRNESPENSNSPFNSDFVFGASAASSGASTSSEDASKPHRKNLSELTDEEKYLRIREQNNIASREYRNRKKTKKTSEVQELNVLMERNKNLRQLTAVLQTQYKNCVKAKLVLEKLGYSFPGLNS